MLEESRTYSKVRINEFSPYEWHVYFDLKPGAPAELYTVGYILSKHKFKRPPETHMTPYWVAIALRQIFPQDETLLKLTRYLGETHVEERHAESLAESIRLQHKLDYEQHRLKLYEQMYAAGKFTPELAGDWHLMIDPRRPFVQPAAARVDRLLNLMFVSPGDFVNGFWFSSSYGMFVLWQPEGDEPIMIGLQGNGSETDSAALDDFERFILQTVLGVSAPLAVATIPLPEVNNADS